MDGKQLVSGKGRRAVTLSGCASAPARRRHSAASSQPAMDRASVPRRARRLLRESFDHDEFRAGQLEAIIDIVDAAQPNAAVTSLWPLALARYVNCVSPMIAQRGLAGCWGSFHGMQCRH